MCLTFYGCAPRAKHTKKINRRKTEIILFNFNYKKSNKNNIQKSIYIYILYLIYDSIKYF